MQLKSRHYEAADMAAAMELCYEKGWSDGLPVVPPTRGAIERMIDYLGRDPKEVVGIIAPRNGVEEIRVTEEDEYFPPPRNIRDLQAAIGLVAAVMLGGPADVSTALDDRRVAASDVLASLHTP